MAKELSASARKVQEILQNRGFTSEVVELPGSTRTAKEAAQAIGCTAVFAFTELYIVRCTLTRCSATEMREEQCIVVPQIFIQD
jgi:hypothetical protein